MLLSESFRPHAGGLAFNLGEPMKRSLIPLALSALLLAGCGQGAPTNAATTPTASSEPDSGLTPAQTADNFVALPGGLAVRWATSAEKSQVSCPSYASSCFRVAIQTNEACHSGIYIEIQLKNANGTIIGKANEITPGMGAGDKGIYPVSSTIAAAQASMSDVHCMG